MASRAMLAEHAEWHLDMVCTSHIPPSGPSGVLSLRMRVSHWTVSHCTDAGLRRPSFIVCQKKSAKYDNRARAPPGSQMLILWKVKSYWRCRFGSVSCCLFGCMSCSSYLGFPAWAWGWIWGGSQTLRLVWSMHVPYADLNASGIIVWSVACKSLTNTGNWLQYLFLIWIRMCQLVFK